MVAATITCLLIAHISFHSFIGRTTHAQERSSKDGGVLGPSDAIMARLNVHLSVPDHSNGGQGQNNSIRVDPKPKLHGLHSQVAHDRRQDQANLRAMRLILRAHKPGYACHHTGNMSGPSPAKSSLGTPYSCSLSAVTDSTPVKPSRLVSTTKAKDWMAGSLQTCHKRMYVCFTLKCGSSLQQHREAAESRVHQPKQTNSRT